MRVVIFWIMCHLSPGHEKKALLITQVYGDAHFKIITFNHDWESDSGGNTPHSKAYIQFSSDGQSGEITFEIRYYGSSYNQNIKFLFFSRVISVDVNSVQYQNQIMYFEDINLNQNRIIKLQDPIDDNDAVNNPSSGNPPDDCALNFKYFHSQRGDLLRQINEVGSKAFSKDGSDPIGGK